MPLGNWEGALDVFTLKSGDLLISVGEILADDENHNDSGYFCALFQVLPWGNEMKVGRGFDFFFFSVAFFPTAERQ